MARKLRITWSVGFGILCLLLIVMWVRSGRAEDQFGLTVTSGNFFQITSALERVSFNWTAADHVRNPQQGFIIGHELPEWFANRVRQLRKDKNIENALGFSVIRGPQKSFVSIPHLWLVAMFASIASAPG